MVLPQEPFQKAVVAGDQKETNASLVCLQEADDPEHMCHHEAGSPL